MIPLYYAPESNPSIKNYTLVSTRTELTKSRRDLDLVEVERTYEVYNLLYVGRRKWIQQELLRSERVLRVVEQHAYNW